MSSSTITVNSNFPEILSSDVEYTISFQIISEERINSILRYSFSDENVIKRMSKTEEFNSFFYTETVLTFILSGVGKYNFSLELNDELIYEKNFILEKILDYPIERNSVVSSQCFLCPENVNFNECENTISFSCKQVSNDNWIDYYLNNNIKNNKKIYCGLRYRAPDLSTHWKIVTKSEYGIQDSGFVEFTHIDGNQVDWYFPIAHFVENKFQVCEKEYVQSVGFYKLVGGEFVELAYQNYYIRIVIENDSNDWNEEIVELLELTVRGSSSDILIEQYCKRHDVDDMTKRQMICDYKNNFGEFALQHNLIRTKQQKILLNYLTNYQIFDTMIQSGCNDLISVRNEVTDFVKKYYNKLI